MKSSWPVGSVHDRIKRERSEAQREAEKQLGGMMEALRSEIAELRDMVGKVRELSTATNGHSEGALIRIAEIVGGN